MDAEKLRMRVVITRPTGCPSTSVQTYDFSTLYASISHKMLKSRIEALVHNPFKKKDGSTRYTDIKGGQKKGYFINSINGGGEM